MTFFNVIAKGPGQGETTMPIPRNGLLAEWLLDGNGLDTEGSNDLASANVSYIPSIAGDTAQSARLNGTNAYFSGNDVFGGLSECSLNYVFDFNDTDDNDVHVIFGDQGNVAARYGFILAVYEASAVGQQLYFWTANATSNINVRYDEAVLSGAQMITMNYNGTTGDMDLYVDNVLQTPVTSVGTMPATVSSANTNAIIGKDITNVRYMQGDYGLMRAYNRTLMADDRAVLFAETRL